MMNKFFTFFTIITLGIVSIINVPVAFADDDVLGYVVSPIQPKTQIDPQRSFFYIETKPNKEQTLDVKVKSTKKEPVKIKIFAEDAITGDSGTIAYESDGTNQDETLKDPITSIVKIETPEITVANFEEKVVKVKVNPPKNSYNGVKMGAIVFMLDDAKEADETVSTEFSYRVGLITSESGDELNNGTTINLNSAKASIKRGKKMILSELQNPEPKVIEGLTIVATITEKGSEKIVKQRKVEDYTMAPNSHFDFEMDWGTKNLPSGEYTIKFDIENDYHEWHLSKDFTITGEQARKMNEESAFKIITPTWLKATAISLVVITVINSIWIFFRRKKWEASWRKLRIAKKKKASKSDKS